MATSLLVKHDTHWQPADAAVLNKTAPHHSDQAYDCFPSPRRAERSAMERDRNLPWCYHW